MHVSLQSSTSIFSVQPSALGHLLHVNSSTSGKDGSNTSQTGSTPVVGVWPVVSTTTGKPFPLSTERIQRTCLLTQAQDQFRQIPSRLLRQGRHAILYVNLARYGQSRI